MNPLHPKKLILSKWTAVHPENKEKHFVVTKVIEPDIAGGAVDAIEIEAVHSGRSRSIEWRTLRDASQWRQGWV